MHQRRWWTHRERERKPDRDCRPTPPIGCREREECHQPQPTEERPTKEQRHHTSIQPDAVASHSPFTIGGTKHQEVRFAYVWVFLNLPPRCHHPSREKKRTRGCHRFVSFCRCCFHAGRARLRTPHRLFGFVWGSIQPAGLILSPQNHRSVQLTANSVLITPTTSDSLSFVYSLLLSLCHTNLKKGSSTGAPTTR